MKSIFYNAFILSVVALGFFLRFSIYQAGHELWLDEANTAHKICAYDLGKISRLDSSSYDQMHAYPIGFMATIKMLVKQKGPFENVLRLFPFLCSLTALVFFWRWSLQLFPTAYRLPAVLLFSVSTSILAHSSELKPYASDMLSVILVSYLFFKHSQGARPLREIILFGLIGLVVILLSFPGIFVLFMSAGMLLLKDIFQKNWKTAKIWGGLLTAWGIGFICYFFLSLRFFLGDQRLFESWAGSFFPWSASIYKMLEWTFLCWKTILAHSGSEPLASAILGIMGIWLLFRKDLNALLIFIAPFLSVLILSILHLYPIHDRTTTFLAPYLIILMTYGAISLFEKPGGGIKKTAGLILLAVVITSSVIPLKNYRSIGANSQNIREMVPYLYSHFEAGDGLMMNDSAKHGFNYYSRFRNDTLPVTRIYLTYDRLETVDKSRCLALLETPSERFYAMCDPSLEERKGKAPDDYSHRPKRLWLLLSHYQQEVKDFLVTFLTGSDYILEETVQKENTFLLLFKRKNAP